MDIIALSALIVAIIGALGSFISHIHLKKIKIWGCIESDCTKDKTPPHTPHEHNINQTTV